MMKRVLCVLFCRQFRIQNFVALTYAGESMGENKTEPYQHDLSVVPAPDDPDEVEYRKGLHCCL